MSDRERRIKKVEELRQKEVDESLQGLAQGEAAVQSAQKKLTECHEELQRSLKLRLVMAEEGGEIQQFLTLQDWVSQCQQLRVLSEKRHVESIRARAASQVKVKKTLMKLKQVQVLLERIHREDAKKISRLEAKAEDEFASRAAQSRRKLT